MHNPTVNPAPTVNTYRPRHLLPPDLAEQLRAARIRAGLSLREAAAMAGVSASFISRLERGLRAPRVDTARRVARVLGLDEGVEGWLMDEAVEPWDGR